MAKIGLKRALELFELDSSSPTGLKWRIDNPRRHATQKRGEHVGFYDRGPRGYIPIAEVRAKLKEHQQSQRGRVLKKSSKATQAILEMREKAIKEMQSLNDEDRQEVEPEILTDSERRDLAIMKQANRRYFELDGDIIAARAMGSYEVGDKVETPYLCFCGHYLDLANTMKALNGEDFDIHYSLAEGETHRQVSDRLNGDFYVKNLVKRMAHLLSTRRHMIDDVLAQISEMTK